MDLTLLKKDLRRGIKTSKEIAEKHGIANGGRVAQYRERFGIERKKTIRCVVCANDRAPNCYKFGFPRICIICRCKYGIEERHQKAGPGRGHIRSVKKVKAVCLKCNRPFEARTGYAGKRIDYLCDRCKFINSFLGDEEGELRILYG